MKLYAVFFATLWSVAFLFSSVIFSMENKKSISPVKRILPLLVQERKKQDILCLSDSSGAFQKNITFEQAQISSFLKNLIDPKKTDNSYVFEASFGPGVIKMFVEYIQNYGSHDLIFLGEKKEIMEKKSGESVFLTELSVASRNSFLEKGMKSKKFSVLSDVLSLAEKYGVSSLASVVKGALVSKIMHSGKLDKSGNKDSLVKYPKFYHDEPFSLAYEKKIFDVTLSPNSKYIVVTAHKNDNNFLGTFYACCNDSRMLKTFEIHKSTDAFLFTPDSSRCVVCSDTFFKFIDCKDLSLIKTFLGDEKDHYHFFVMSPCGNRLLVSTLSGKAFLYEHSDVSGMFEKTKKNFKIPCCGMKPIFTPDSKELMVSEGAALIRYSCETGEELQKTSFYSDSVLESICMHPKGTFVALVLDGVCRIYNNVKLEKILFMVPVNSGAQQKPFFSVDGAFFAATSGRKCFVFRCGDDSFDFSQEYRCRSNISQGSFFGDASYLMLSDNMTCDIYDCHKQELIKDINVMCLDGAVIVVSNDGGHLIVTCENTSTMYAVFPLQAFFKVMNDVLEPKNK
jgi:hypothetical protein